MKEEDLPKYGEGTAKKTPNLRTKQQTHERCTKLSEQFVEEINLVMRQMGYCCGQKFSFTPLVQFCFGITKNKAACKVDRDQQHYYMYESETDGEQCIFCVNCFEALPNERIDLNENTPDPPNWIPKSMFQKKIDMEPFEHCQYTRAHIWASPPDEGVDYIFHCRPTQQKIPKPKRLQDWYKTMLNNGQMEGIVYSYKDIFHTQRDAGLDTPMKLPYFEGDYWPRIIDECIRAAEKQGITVMANCSRSWLAMKSPISPFGYFLRRHCHF